MDELSQVTPRLRFCSNGIDSADGLLDTACLI
jgi:hypothetical protein